MSRLGTGAFALSSSGEVFISLTEFDGVHSPEDALRIANRHGAVLFIGVQLLPSERMKAMRRLQDGYEEAAAFAAHRQQRRGDRA